MTINIGKKEERIYSATFLEGNLEKSVISFENTHTSQPINSTSKNYPKETIINVLKVDYKESHSVLYNSKHLKII